MSDPGMLGLAPVAAPRRSRRDFLAAVSSRRERGEDYWIRVHRRAMACRFEITLASQQASRVPAARVALDEIDQLEDELTVFRETSTISHLNREAADRAVEVDAPLLDLLRDCVALHRATGGAFDITSTPLSRCWGFLQREGRLPPADAIDAARARVGCDALSLDGLGAHGAPATGVPAARNLRGGVERERRGAQGSPQATEPGCGAEPHVKARRTVRFTRPGIELNLGAIGKGYALDRIADSMRRSGVTEALLSAGQSSLLAIGAADGGWHVDVVSPRITKRDGRPLARVWLRDAAIGTSGAGEQYVMIDGVRYGHVIDPRTGWPARGVVSASVIATRAAYADALSTAFLVGGAELAARYCAEHPGTMALVTLEGADSPIVFGRHAGVRVETAAQPTRMYP